MTSTTHNIDPDWFQDPEHLLAEIRAAHQNHVDIDAPDIEGYRRIRLFRRGGQGVVYLAEHTMSGRQVAIKVLSIDIAREDKRAVRFDREIELVESLDHPGIVRVDAHGTTFDGRRFLVMEYVDGAAWDVFVDRGTGNQPAGPPARETILTAFLGVCDAVGHAHLRGIIHRDLKPTNIKVGQDGVARVLDFGLAKSWSAPLDSGLTQTADRFLGSVHWSSPEQADGRLQDVDTRSDIYALGVLLFYSLTAEMPYGTSTGLRDLLQRIVEKPPRRLRDVNSDIPADLDTIVSRCLEKDPADRYQHVADLSRDLRHVLADRPIERRLESTLRSTQRTLVRYRAAIGLATAAAVVLAVFSLFTWLAVDRAADAERLARARLEESRAANDRALTATMILEDLIVLLGSDSGAEREPALLAALEQTADELAHEQQPAIEARMRFAIGHAYAMLSRWESSELNLYRAAQLNTRIYEQPHPESAATIARLADVNARRSRSAPTILGDRSLWLNARQGRDGPIEFYRLMQLRPETFSAASDPVQFNEADRLYRDAIAQYRSLGAGHERALGAAMVAHAELLFSTGSPEQAYGVFEDAIGLLVDHCGLNDRVTLEAMAIAAAAWSAGRMPERASKAYLTLADEAPSVFGRSIRPALLWRAGSSRIEANDPIGAEILYRRALVEECVVLADRHSDHAEVLRETAASLAASGGESPILPAQYQRALTAIRDVFGSVSADDSAMFRELGLTLLASGSPERAEPLLRHGHGISTGHLGHEAPELTRCKGALGICLARLGFFEESEILLLKSRELSERVNQNQPELQEIALFRLATLYDLWNKPVRSAAYQQELNQLEQPAMTGNDTGTPDG